MVRGRLVIKSLLPLRPRLLAPQYQSRLLHQSPQIPSHHPHLALAQTAFPVRAKQVHVHRNLPKSRRSENSSYSTVFICTSLFCAVVIQVIIFIQASRDTVRCYGKDGDDHEVRNTMSMVMGADESRAEGIAQPSPLIRESQLLSLLYQSASSQICPHGPVLVHLLVRTCAHRCCRRPRCMMAV